MKHLSAKSDVCLYLKSSTEPLQDFLAGLELQPNHAEMGESSKQLKWTSDNGVFVSTIMDIR
jgi:hypothetical protein